MLPMNDRFLSANEFGCAKIENWFSPIFAAKNYKSKYNFERDEYLWLWLKRKHLFYINKHIDILSKSI